MALRVRRDIVSATANNAGFTKRRGKRAVKRSDRIIGGLALLSAAIIIIKLAGAISGHDLIQMAVDATRPKDAGGWPGVLN